MKAQLSIFIIMGLLIVLAFGIIIAASTREHLALQPVVTQPLTDYVTQCLALTTNDALTLLGLQGGYIFEEQGGTNQPVKSYTATNKTMPFIILAPQGTVGPYSSEPPEYPFATFPYSQNATLFTGYYGTSALLPLYSELPTGTTTQSIQATLEQAIATHLPACATFEPFIDKGYRVTSDTPTVRVIIPSAEHDDGLHIELAWPLSITLPTDETLRLEHFATTHPLHLAQLYNAAKTIIESDITNITYVPTHDAYTLTTTPLDQHTIVALTDATGYTLLILRENRRPALWHVDVPPLVVHTTTDQTTQVLIAGNNLIIDDPCPTAEHPPIRVNATDPDEQPTRVVLDVTEIPMRATGTTYPLTLYASDDTNDIPWYDYQTIPLMVTTCVE